VTSSPRSFLVPLRSRAKAWKRNLIYKSEPAKNAPTTSQSATPRKTSPGTAGTGLDMVVIDWIRMAISISSARGRVGCNWFENLGTKVSACSPARTGFW